MIRQPKEQQDQVPVPKSQEASPPNQIIKIRNIEVPSDHLRGPQDQPSLLAEPKKRLFGSQVKLKTIQIPSSKEHEGESS
jgi:hypothetical protein